MSDSKNNIVIGLTGITIAGISFLLENKINPVELSPLLFAFKGSFEIGYRFFADSFSSHIHDKWLKSKNGIINHDLQKAFIRGIINALNNILKDYKNISTDTNEIDNVTYFIKELKNNLSDKIFNYNNPLITDKDINNYLYNPEISDKELWNLVNEDNSFNTLSPSFKIYFKENFLNQVKYWFFIDIKQDNSDSNKAWRAYHLMFNESLVEFIKSTTVLQEIDHKTIIDIEKILAQINNKLSQSKSRKVILQEVPDLGKIDDYFSNLTSLSIETLHIVKNIEYDTKEILKFNYKLLSSKNKLTHFISQLLLILLITICVIFLFSPALYLMKGSSIKAKKITMIQNLDEYSKFIELQKEKTNGDLLEQIKKNKANTKSYPTYIDLTDVPGYKGISFNTNEFNEVIRKTEFLHSFDYRIFSFKVQIVANDIYGLFFNSPPNFKSLYVGEFNKGGVIMDYEYFFEKENSIKLLKLIYLMHSLMISDINNNSVPWSHTPLVVFYNYIISSFKSHKASVG